MTTELFSSEGVEYQSASPTPDHDKPALQKLRQAFLSGVQFRVGTHRGRMEALCFLRVRLAERGRAEQFYGYYYEDDDNQGFDQLLPAYRQQVEQQWGSQLVVSADDAQLLQLFRTVEEQPPTKLPGSAAVHDQIRNACIQDQQQIVDVPSERTAVAFVKQYFSRDGRTLAIADQYDSELLGGVNVVLLPSDVDTVTLR